MSDRFILGESRPWADESDRSGAALLKKISHGNYGGPFKLCIDADAQWSDVELVLSDWLKPEDFWNIFLSDDPSIEATFTLTHPTMDELKSAWDQWKSHP